MRLCVGVDLCVYMCVGCTNTMVFILKTLEIEFMLNVKRDWLPLRNNFLYRIIVVDSSNYLGCESCRILRLVAVGFFMLCGACVCVGLLV